MSLKDDLEKEVSAVFRGRWNERDGNVVPDDKSISLDNDAVKIKATVLYADMAGSTKLVDEETQTFAAEIYKTYLHCAAKVIRSENGEITAYDGDRIMAVFIGDLMNTRAVRSAMKINFAVVSIITPAIKAIYTSKDYVPKQVIGVDTSDLLVAKTGIRGANDLVWVGRAANHAAKLTELPPTFATYITAEVYAAMSPSLKTSDDGRTMWERATWNTFNNELIYRSTWWWRVP